MEEFQNNFSRPLFIIIFRTKILFSGPYSILTGHTKVESVAYQVLKEPRKETRDYLYSYTCFTKPISEFAHFGKSNHKTKTKKASLIYKIALKEILLKRNATLNIKISISRPSECTEKFANVVYNDKVYVVCKLLLIKSWDGQFL